MAVLRWGQRGTGPPNLAQPSPPPKFLDTVVLLLVELIDSIVISLSLPNNKGPGPPNIFS